MVWLPRSPTPAGIIKRSIVMSSSQQGFYEFFAGGGMARLGLGSSWNCLFANDFSEKKAAAYRRNFRPAAELRVGDVRDLTVADLPGHATLAWASFPCQDLSLAGERKGLRGERSGTFWTFWALMEGLAEAGRRVPMVALENVVGALSSHGGRDFADIIGRIAVSGYRVGALVMDASLWVPQSRPRLFIVAIDRSLQLPSRHVASEPDPNWHSIAVRKAVACLGGSARESWVWWKLPRPAERTVTLMDVIEDDPETVEWHSPEQTQRLVSLMSPLHREKLQKAQREGLRAVGTIYRRTRPDGAGAKVQRAEIRFDQISGCLRTPAGGSSRQTIMLIDRGQLRSRLLSSREAARLMGVGDNYGLPDSYNDAYHLMGDGVAVPVVRWLSKHLLEPIAKKALTPVN